MNAPPGWLPAVAAAHAADAGRWSAGDVTVRRVRGGYNNALYRVWADGASYACKLCVPDERHRAAREYDALRLLRAAGLDIAPEPLWLDASPTTLPYPVVVYRWLEGDALHTPLTSAQLSALLEALQQMHALRPGVLRPDLRDAWFQWFDWAPYLEELQASLTLYGAWLAAHDPAGPELRDRLARLVARTLSAVRAGDVSPRRDAVPLRLCRMDHNLANGVWGPDGCLRWVDWEYSGWGDPAMDLAELRWHVALLGLGEAGHRWLRERYRRPAEDGRFERRLALWDRIIATRWPFLILRWLWSQDQGPDRLRLTRPAANPTEQRARLLQLIDRAERLP
jgi:aminoglycoside phosphotransferase (APT) family kinase protein